MQILSYAFSIIGLICMILASILKNAGMKTILALVCFANAIVATGYLLAGSGINGAATLYLGAAQTFINYFFERKNKPLPAWLLVCYAVSIIAVNLWVGGLTWLGVLVIIASLTFIMCIIQKSGAKYRFWTIVNMVLWCTYDVLSKSYNGLLTHIPLLVFTVAGMLLYDRKNTQKNEENP
ncbi:MAG: YgjV family protein [Clostridia bacterium]|nr:YgjV family protein [Clostridia bacterium]